jgi:gluconokinase
MLSHPSLNADAGTFCYRAREDAFLLGCASSNGGNVLDWARKTFGPMPTNVAKGVELPIFLPFMNGERSLEWNPNLRETWHGRLDMHTPAQLSRAVTEGVLFNIAQYVEVVERESGAVAEQIILSGNAFQEPLLAELLASLLGRELVMPESAGLATLRGAAIYAWRALGHDAAQALESEIESSARVPSKPDPSLMDRFARFKELRRAQ